MKIVKVNVDNIEIDSATTVETLKSLKTLTKKYLKVVLKEGETDKGRTIYSVTKRVNLKASYPMGVILYLWVSATKKGNIKDSGYSISLSQKGQDGKLQTIVLKQGQNVSRFNFNDHFLIKTSLIKTISNGIKNSIK